MQNHAGVKYLNRNRNVEYLRNRLDQLIKDKTAELNVMEEKQDGAMTD